MWARKSLSPETSTRASRIRPRSSKTKVGLLGLMSWLVERDNKIGKDNALLIRNLMEISHGKRVKTLRVNSDLGNWDCLNEAEWERRA
jgi:hypothetical protein